ncbi:peptidase [Coprinopsis marcescibilis]|uniref:Peptidase n=1 Tax=Coprinopsis marcescibilis TaxID=230819 RepID=A0A5C3KFZ7_COPMA|nr:peptidase [Coprinopsis marcescibilis]
MHSMKSLGLLALVPHFLNVGTTFAAFPTSSLQRSLDDQIIPNKFIFEVESEANIPNKRSFTQDLDAVYSHLRARQVNFDIIEEFDEPDFFVGASVLVESADDVATLENLPGIKAIYPVRRYDRPSPATHHIVQGPNDPKLPPIGEAPHILTGVDKLHARGHFGKGIKIGILDTGIDYNHPYLGGGFGPGHKVEVGFDFVGDDFDGTNTPYPDNDPLDLCAGHGTHVAGIIGTDPGNEYNFTGVAHEATQGAYRIFGCEGFTQDGIIIAALFRGVNDGMDILSLSLGGANGWTNSASAVVASRIAESGKIVTIAAGNDGSRGSWYTASPSSSINAISVGSLENSVIPLQTANLQGTDQPSVIYFSLKPLSIEGEWPIYVTSNDTTIIDDACDPLPEDTPDLSQFVTLVRRGTCTFVTKLKNIADKGGNYTLIYDNGNGFTTVALGNYTAALIQAQDGQHLVNQYLAGDDIKVSFPQVGGNVPYANPRGGLMSTFSTYGPTNDFYFKPAISAPGGNILAPYPQTIGTWAVLSGTSMATPYAAGAAALYLTVKGKSPEVARAARTVFETTALTIPSTLEEGALPQTVTQTGAGLINVYAALFSETTVTPGELILNDTAHFRGTHRVSITNGGSSPKRYKLSHTAAGTALTIQAGSNSPELGPVPLSDAAARVTIVPSEFTLAAGRTREVVVSVRPPIGVVASRFPVYSGFIHISSPGENHRVTYLGLAASLKDKRVLDDYDEWAEETLPAVVAATTGEVQTGPANYTFAEGDIPVLVYRMAFGSPRLRVDLVEPTIRLRTTLNPRQLPRVDRPRFTFPSRTRPGSFSSVGVVGTLGEYTYVSRNNADEDSSYSTFPVYAPFFSNGTAIPAGSYRLLLRALRVTGNPERQEDYESWLSPVIGVP